MANIVDLANADRVGKQYLIDSLVEHQGFSRPDAQEAVNGVLEAIVAAFRANASITLSNIGTFRREVAPPRLRRNPFSGGTIDVDAQEVVRWKTSRTLADVLNGRADRDSLASKAPKGSLS